MEPVAHSPLPRVTRSWLRPLLLILGFGGAVAVRVTIGGVGVQQSPTAGLIFALTLVCLTVLNPARTTLNRTVVGYGLAGALCLVVPVVILRLPYARFVSGDAYLPWAAVVAVVALTEEAFLRGALFDTLSRAFGTTTAVVITAMLFALLHLPLYGLRALPLDFVTGLWFGYLRIRAGSWTAPGIAHVLTDLVSWWLR